MLKRIYMPEYELEITVGNHVVQMQRDKDGKPFVEIEEREEHNLISAVANMGAASESVVMPEITECPACAKPWIKEQLCHECGLCIACCQHDPFNGIPRENKTAETGEFDLRTHAMNSVEARAFAAETTDKALLASIRAGELKHPQYDGGRATVVSAIDNRIKELQENG